MRIIGAMKSIWAMLTALVYSTEVHPSTRQRSTSPMRAHPVDSESPKKTTLPLAKIRRQISSELQAVQSVRTLSSGMEGIRKPRFRLENVRSVHASWSNYTDQFQLGGTFPFTPRQRTVPSFPVVFVQGVSILGKRRREDSVNTAKRRRVATFNTADEGLRMKGVQMKSTIFWGYRRRNQTTFRPRKKQPFAPRFWGTRGMGAEEFSRVVKLDYGAKFFNQIPLQMLQYPFRPCFSARMIVGPVEFGRWIGAGFGARDIADIL